MLESLKRAVDLEFATGLLAGLAAIVVYHNDLASTYIAGGVGFIAGVVIKRTLFRR